ncbi:helitron_like_N domain-containing protein [Caerostris darwini]|uniref:Helitron_like_N domain-containing protein n=1 Tax=Caerostris darwini TaxID=1538125 RepID=A0AAV4S8U5_9ARAC|nr:helitron_like_N domain-containing protein [Caerostris darwini]
MDGHDLLGRNRSGRRGCAGMAREGMDGAIMARAGLQASADKTPSGEHTGRFNAPTVEEVAIIMVGDPVDNRAIKITRPDSTVHVISDLHRSYDALQHPLIFWQGQDGYHININTG